MRESFTFVLRDARNWHARVLVRVHFWLITILGWFLDLLDLLLENHRLSLQPSNYPRFYDQEGAWPVLTLVRHPLHACTALWSFVGCFRCLLFL